MSTIDLSRLTAIRERAKLLGRLAEAVVNCPLKSWTHEMQDECVTRLRLGESTLIEIMQELRVHSATLQTQAATIERLRSALAGLVGADSRSELEQMEAVIRLAPAPDEDKTVSINAIHALIATEAK